MNLDQKEASWEGEEPPELKTTLGGEVLDGAECSKVSAALAPGMSPHRAGEFQGSADHRDHCTFLGSSHGRGTLGSRASIATMEATDRPG